ncbi:MAG TPA: hypothetical protein PKA53_01765 [Sphingobacterium sp.]|nr:hypothetical protein [Sphingobacterium sp.]
MRYFIFSILFCYVSLDVYSIEKNTTIKHDTVFVTDFGLQPSSRINAVQAVQKALEVCRTKDNPVLVFPKGRYDFWPQHAIEKHYYESNTTDNNPKRNGIFIEGFTNLTVDGQESMFVYHDRMQPITIDRSNGISIKNILIDWDIPLTAQGEVVNVTDKHIDLLIDQRQYPYVIENDKLVFVGEGWKSQLKGVMEFERETRLIAYRTGDVPSALGRNWRNYKAHELAHGKVRLYNEFQRKPAVGNILVLRHSDRDHAMIFINNSKDISIERLDGHHCPGIGVLSQYSENISFNKVRMIPNYAKDRYFSAHADGFHFSNCRGMIRVDSCEFAGLMDDPINIHGTYVKVIKRISDQKLLCRFMESMSVGMEWARTGEEVAFIDNKSLQTIGRGSVVGFKALSSTDFEIDFLNDIPQEIHEGYGLENLYWTPATVITNSIFGSNRARGILVTTPKKVLIENNTFESSGSAILIAGDVNSWFESGAVTDIIIRGNRFLSPCNTSDYQFTKAVISIFPEIPVMDEQTPPYHSNITIEKNEFFSFDYPILFAQSVTGLKFEGNNLHRSYDFEPYHQEQVSFSLINCRKVSIKNNRVDPNLFGKNIQLKLMNKKDIVVQKEIKIL